MLDCNNTLTHVMFTLNSKTRQYDMTTELIDKCSWFRTEKSERHEASVLTKPIVKVRISLQDSKKMPNIKLGDVLINGIVDVRNMTEGELRKAYPDSMKVEDCTYNLNSMPYSRHIRVVGS